MGCLLDPPFIDRAPHGAEHIKEVLTGSILWVKGSEVLSAAVAYTVIGVFHWVFRRRFMAITDDPEGAREQGINIVLWDLIFYMTFGFVITFSVNTAGVLLVFVFLVVPAVIGAAITDNFKHQLLIGWSMGTLVSGLGLAFSYWLDLPAGPAVVSFYGLVLLLVALTLYVVRSKRWLRALAHVALGCVSLLLIVGYFHGLRSLINAVPGWRRGGDHEAHVVICDLLSIRKPPPERVPRDVGVHHGPYQQHVHVLRLPVYPRLA